MNQSKLKFVGIPISLENEIYDKVVERLNLLEIPDELFVYVKRCNIVNLNDELQFEIYLSATENLTDFSDFPANFIIFF